jgi:hypothetical protein
MNDELAKDNMVSKTLSKITTDYPEIIDCYCCGTKDLVSIFSKEYKAQLMGHETLKYTIKTLSLKVCQVQIGIVRMNGERCRYNIHTRLGISKIFEYGRKEFGDL